MNASAYYELLSHRQLPVILDDERLAPLVTKNGFSIIPFDDYDFLRPHELPALVLASKLDSTQKLLDYWKTSANILAHLAVAKFDASPAASEYALNQLLSLDFEAALARRAAYQEQVLACAGIELVTAAGTLTCTLKEELEIPNPGDTMQTAWMYSVAEFLEFSMVNLEGECSSFQVDGELAFDGLIHLSNSDELKARFAATWNKLQQRCAAGGNRVVFKDNRIERLVIAGADETALLHETLGDAERGSAATEWGLGCAEFPRQPDWSQNALPHKTAHGAYIGIGMGWKLPHVDFIASGAQCRFLPA